MPGATANTRKLVANIVTVDPTQRLVEGALKDGGRVDIAVWEMPSAFRWPKPGEQWTVYYTGNVPRLGQRFAQITDPYPVEQLPVGAIRLDATSIYDAAGNLVSPTPFSATVGIPIAATQGLVAHGLSGPPSLYYATPTTDPQQRWWVTVDATNIYVNLASAAATTSPTFLVTAWLAFG